MASEWAEEHTARIARAVRSARGKRSGRWLSDRTAELGHRVPHSSISELETGKRKAITTIELFMLARALEIPPVQLLFPDLPDGQVEVLPGKRVRSAEAAMWMSGEIKPSGGDEAERERLTAGVQLAQASRTLEQTDSLSGEWAIKHTEYERLVNEGRIAKDDKRVVEAELNFERHYREYKAALRRILSIPNAVVDEDNPFLDRSLDSPTTGREEDK